jgi:hypothetical protein
MPESDKASKIIVDRTKKCCKGSFKDSCQRKKLTITITVNQLNNPKPLVKCVVSIWSQDHHLKTIVSGKEGFDINV